MNLIEPFSQEIVSRDMPPPVALSMTLFIGAALGGFYCMDLYQRWKKTEQRLDALEQSVHDSQTLVESQTETFQEYDQRIREKQDYDDTLEIEEHKYQAWIGEYEQDNRKIEIKLWRDKLTSVKENQNWLAWTGKKDGSTTVRDFYLGNLNPDFHWEVEERAYYITNVSETFVENWDSVIHLEIKMTFYSKQSLLDFVESSEFWPNLTMNLALKKVLCDGLVNWKKVLISEEEE